MTRNEESIWNRFSGIYDVFMKKDIQAYRKITERIKGEIEKDLRVLEVATGTGEFALGIAANADSIDAMDLSPKMIDMAIRKAAKMGVTNIRFSVQNAYSLPYEAGNYDIVLIANTLHIMPQPEKALAEIKRVLKRNGKMIAPTFVHAGSKRAAVLSRVMSLTGFRAYHKWTEQSYCEFLVKNGFHITSAELMKASFPLAYVVAEKEEA